MTSEKETYIKKYSALTMANRKKRKDKAEIYISGTWTFVDNAARIVHEKIKEMESKGVYKYGKETAIQSILNEAYSRKHG